jgi:putative transposase
MPEHAHVLVFPLNEIYDVSNILQSIKQSVSRRATNYLRQHAQDWLDRLKVVWPDGRMEHRFWQQGGGYDRNIFTPEAVWASIDYLHNNPVHRKLAALATDWPWSSANWYAGRRTNTFVIDEGIFE